MTPSSFRVNECMVWDCKSGPSEVLSSNRFLLYLRNCVPIIINIEFPFLCKVVCNVSELINLTEIVTDKVVFGTTFSTCVVYTKTTIIHLSVG